MTDIVDLVTEYLSVTIMTPEGLHLSFELISGNNSDKKTRNIHHEEKLPVGRMEYCYARFAFNELVDISCGSALGYCVTN